MRREWLLSLAALLLALGLAAACAVRADAETVDTVMKDQWRFLYLVDDYHQGTLSIGDFLDSHSSHIKAGYKALFLLEGLVFGLDMRVDRLIGIMGLAASCWMLFLGMRGSGLGRSPMLLFGAYLCVLLLSFSNVRNAYFHYSLLSVSSFVGWLAFLGLWMVGEVYCRNPRERLGLLLATCALLFIMVFGIGGGRSPAVLLVTLAAFGLRAVEGGAGRRRTLRFLAVVLACSIPFESAYWGLVSAYAVHTDVQAGYHAVLADLPGALLFALRALAAAALPTAWLDRISVSSQVWVGGLVLAVHLVAAGLYLQLRAWRQSLIPLMLILYAGCFVGELTIARFGLGFDNAVAPRYTAETMMGMLGCVWVFALGIQRWQELGWDRLAITALATMVAGILLWQSLDRVQGRDEAAAAKVQLRQVELLRAGRFGELAPWYCPDAGLCRHGDAILRRYHLVPYRGQ